MINSLSFTSILIVCPNLTSPSINLVASFVSNSLVTILFNGLAPKTSS